MGIGGLPSSLRRGARRARWWELATRRQQHALKNQSDDLVVSSCPRAPPPLCREPRDLAHIPSALVPSLGFLSASIVHHALRTTPAFGHPSSERRGIQRHPQQSPPQSCAVYSSPVPSSRRNSKFPSSKIRAACQSSVFFNPTTPNSSPRRTTFADQPIF